MFKYAVVVLAVLAAASAQVLLSSPYYASPSLYSSAYYGNGYAYPYAYNAYSAPLAYSSLGYNAYLYR